MTLTQTRRRQHRQRPQPLAHPPPRHPLQRRRRRDHRPRLQRHLPTHRRQSRSHRRHRELNRAGIATELACGGRRRRVGGLPGVR